MTEEEKKKKEIQDDLVKNYRKRMDSSALRLSIRNHMRYTRAKDEFSATDYDKYMSLCYAVRDRIVERWSKTQQSYYNQNVKRVYYLSLEFLLGRALLNNVINLNLIDEVKYVIKKAGNDFTKLLELEPDAGLGNGGLGRLAACYLDSMATLGLPAYGYGLHYEFGIFKQVIQNGFQIEAPDEWLKFGSPWEIERPEYAINVQFYGKSVAEKDEFGRVRFSWKNTRDVLAIPHDIPIIGYGSHTVNTLRLWSARSSNQFDLRIFNHGDYIKAVEDKNCQENISKVLYPNDDIYEGKELRFKQEYFFVAATLQDIIRRYRKTYDNFDRFADKVAIQLNDTHPALGIPELMRLFVDVYGLKWAEAWEITRKTFAFTNHTVMQEAIEKWSLNLFETVLPRHLQIIYEINRLFLGELRIKYPGDHMKVNCMSMVGGDGEKYIRMANLAIIGSHSVNGVAKLHTEILKKEVFKDFYELCPEKFSNKTNGITQRRWLLVANHYLSRLIRAKIGDGWITDFSQITGLLKFAEDRETLINLYNIKLDNKKKLAEYIKKECGVEVNPESVFDSQVKRIHEYKRQFLNALRILVMYNRIKKDPSSLVSPVTFIFSGKSAPGYTMAKLIIKFINSVAGLVNNDAGINGKIKVVFLPNYGVSLAEKIIPASDVSEQVSMAGTEASGTGNMKFAINGALTLGTLDGANIEILEHVGADNIYIFGLNAEQIKEKTEECSYDPREIYESSPEIKAAVDMLRSGVLAGGDKDLFKPLYDSLLFGYGGGEPDRYFLLADIKDYLTKTYQLNNDFSDKLAWQKKALLNMANMGYFSSDRAVKEYAAEIWSALPVKIKS
ncbi:MAG: glycogen/starch/alpha-glucan phosphorylase [Elusimicrobiota bacterium]|nr:glycogen/starch/alpha-glucan phosphorylase [Elusimicrobiota bacterium]